MALVPFDADITIFDFAEITENATYQFPYKYSTGTKYVIVNGTPVLDNGSLNMAVSPGKWMKHETVAE